MQKCTKNIKVNIIFDTGNSIICLVPVQKTAYSNLQSRAWSYRNALLAGISTGKITREQANENWNDRIVQLWTDLVEEPAKSLFPKKIREYILVIEPAGTILELNKVKEEGLVLFKE